ncbi:MAG: zinc-binding dehydrogenase [Anaerolineae bacterium]|nr:zinc-binding dehydrogenase [Anaerolineae bacterium]
MSQPHIPDRMTAVVLESYAGIAGIRVAERSVPTPGHHQVLVKIAASPINPSDQMFLRGLYGLKKPLPIIPGLEASGTVVAVGSGLMARRLLGKRVACVSQSKGDGVWAEYAVTSANYTLPLHKDVDLEQGAMSVVNPLTAIALLQTAQQGGHHTIIHTAAASALGHMILRLSTRMGIRVIHIVRRDAQVALLRDQGAEFVLNSSDTDFDAQLRELCQQYKARLAFDAVAGPLTGRMLAAMPSHSTVTVYGGLSNEPAQASGASLIFRDQTINGFWLTKWFGKRNILQNLRAWRQAQQLLGDDLKTTIRARYRLQDAPQALEDYKAQMTGGKVLFTPGL